jgi:hypothetical protein
MLRTASVVIALSIAAWSPARACTGQVGASIFQDNFADDSGGWDEQPPAATVQPPAYVLALDSQNTALSTLDQTFTATSGDFCMDVVLPAPAAGNNVISAGIMFWATDYNNFTVAQVNDDGSVSAFRQVASVWSNPIFTVQNAPGYNSAANATNSLRVTALSGLTTVYLNGTKIKSFRAQQPTNASLSFGIFIQDGTAAANIPAVKVSGYSVTAGK